MVIVPKYYIGFLALLAIANGHSSNQANIEKSPHTCRSAMISEGGPSTPAHRLGVALKLSGAERRDLLSGVLEAQGRVAQIAPEQRPEFFKEKLELVKHHFTSDELAMLNYHLAKTTSNEFNRNYNQSRMQLAFKSARKKIIKLDLDLILLLGVPTRLTQREIEVVNMRVLDEMSFREISLAIANHDKSADGRIGVSPQQATAIYNNAILKIERSLMNIEVE